MFYNHSCHSKIKFSELYFIIAKKRLSFISDVTMHAWLNVFLENITTLESYEHIQVPGDLDKWDPCGSHL